LAATVFLVGAWRSVREAVALGHTPTPVVVGVDEATVQADQQARWVTLDDPRWHCDEAVEREADVPEKWLLGRVSWTQVPVASPKRVVVVRFEGAIACRALAGRPVTGELTPDRDVWHGGGQVAFSLKSAHPGREIVLLRPGLDAA